MNTDISLEGTYRISTTTNYQGPLEKKSDGLTEIRDGQTQRYDDANCKWTSHFKVLNENEIEMISVADPAEANIDFLLLKPDGSPTRECVTYTSILKLSHKGEKIQMSGQITYGNEIIFITMRSVDTPES